MLSAHLQLNALYGRTNDVQHVRKETKRRTLHNVFFSPLDGPKQRLFTKFNRFQANPAPLKSPVASCASTPLPLGGIIDEFSAGWSFERDLGLDATDRTC